MKSIRTTLLSFLLLGAALAALLCGGFLYETMRESLLHQFDRASVEKLRALGAMLELDGPYLEFNYSADLTPEYEGGPEPEYFEIWYDRQVARRSRTLSRLDDLDLPYRYGSVESPDMWDLDLPDGRQGRAVGLLAPVGWQDDDLPPLDDDEEMEPINVVLVVARSRAGLDETLASLRNAALGSGALLLVLILTTALLAVHVGLRPLRRLGDEVTLIGADSLSRRLSTDRLPQELRTPVDKLNELLVRLDEAFSRERRMTGNVAHELRTPIAELRSAAEVALRWPEDREMSRSAIETARDVATRMGELVAGLLRLARIKNGEAQIEREEFDLHMLMVELWHRWEPLASSRGLRFENEMEPGLVLCTDRILLTHALGNLIDNAVQHAAEDSTISCRAGVGARGGLFISIENATDSLSDADLAHLTEPFWQKDPSRTDTSHSGLGLTLVASIIEALEMELSFHLTETFRVEIGGDPSVVHTVAGPVPSAV